MFTTNFRNSCCLRRGEKGTLLLFLFLFSAATVITLTLFFFVIPSIQEENLVAHGDLNKPLVLEFKGGCVTSMYRHFPLIFNYTSSMHSSMVILDQTGCSKVLEIISTSKGNGCVKDFALQCIQGFACSTSSEEEMSRTALKEAWIKRAKKDKVDETRAWMNIYHGGKSPSSLVRQGNAILSALGLTSIVERIESEIRICQIPKSENLQFACNQAPIIEFNKSSERFVVVEIGAGNGNLLYTLCPPDPLRRLRCYGVELVNELATDANSYQQYINIANGLYSPLKDESATHVFIHGVLPLISLKDGCTLIREGLRLLMPKGILVIGMIFTGFSAAWPTRHHPFFFNDTISKQNQLNYSIRSSILPYCSSFMNENYSQFIEKVEFIWDAPQFAFYAPDFKETGVYLVRLTRSETKMDLRSDEEPHTATPETEETNLYKEMCTNPEKVQRVRDAQILWAERVMEMHRTSIRKKIKKGHYIWVSTQDK